MNYFSHLLGLLSITLVSVSAESEVSEIDSMDMLRFKNHDTLHGKLEKFKAKNIILWKSPESKQLIPFDTKELHRIVLNHGKAHQQLALTSSVHLTNGDCILGEIGSVNSKSVTVKTTYLGDLTISKDKITHLNITPFGGKLLYYGPFDTKQWKTIEGTITESAKKKTNQKKPPKKEVIKEQKQELSSWKHITNSWYSGKKKHEYLTLKDALPDQCKVSLKLTWKNALSACIFLHADVAPPEYTGEKPLYPYTHRAMGHSYYLTIANNNARLHSTSFDKKGIPKTNNFSNIMATIPTKDNQEINLEIRLDKLNKSILLFSDGIFRCKWDLGDEYLGKGAYLAFTNLLYNRESELRVRDIAISQWNGLKDSAASMNAPNKDVILLNNGIDRFSGELEKINDGYVFFQGSFNHQIHIPLKDIQEIHLAENKWKTPSEENKDKKSVFFYIYPHGRLTGTPIKTENGKTHILSPLLGEILLDTSYSNIIDFSHQNNLLDLWDDNF